MSATILRDGDVILIGVALEPQDWIVDFKASAESMITKTLDTRVEVIVVTGAPGLFEVLRSEL